MRIETRLKVAFESTHEVAEALMTNLSRGGLFINTAMPAEPGTRFQLKLQIESSAEILVIPAEVVSNNVRAGFDSGQLGMGVRFLPMEPGLRKKVDDLYEALARRQAEKADEKKAKRT